MNVARLFEVADRARAHEKLTRDDEMFIRKTVPDTFAGGPRRPVPARVRHPAGFSVSGRPVSTFVSAALLLAGQGVLGRRFAASAFYCDVERDLALSIMRSNFERGFPKGTHCCTQCTLAVYPVLEANAIRYFDGPKLAKEVRQLIARRQWRFATPPPQTMLEWSLGKGRRAGLGS